MSALTFSKSYLPKQLFINNEYVESKNSKKLTVHNPVDGSLIADDVPLAGEQDVDAAVAAAEKALKTWRKTSAKERRELLLSLADLVERVIPELIELTTITNGMPHGIGGYEAGAGVEFLRYYAGWIDKFAGESFPQDDGFMKIVRNEPLGVCAGIIPWNAPIALTLCKVAPAVAMGNVFIIKPSEKTPFAALALGQLFKAAGFPPGVIQVLSGDGSTGALLASHMRIRKVAFTGSVGTGKRVTQMAAASNLKRVTLELGGKSPAVVFDDCNLDNAVTCTVNAISMNSGQACFAASRVYVQEGIYEKFIAKYKDAMIAKAKAVGDPTDPATQLGPLADHLQFDRVTGFIERGIKDHQGKLLLGGSRIGNTGYFIEPTVFTDVDADAEIHTTEIFGPVSVVQTFKNEDEVVERANNTSYGLMAGVFTQDINKALRVASEFESGVVGVNCVSMMFNTTPFGGTKESGMGRESGKAALLAYTEPKTIMINMTY